MCKGCECGVYALLSYLEKMNKLFIASPAWATTDESLKDHFGSIGNVLSAVVIKEKMTGRSKGFGFVEYENEADAKAAVEKLNGSELDGRSITVAEARPKE